MKQILAYLKNNYRWFIWFDVTCLPGGQSGGFVHFFLWGGGSELKSFIETFQFNDFKYILFLSNQRPNKLWCYLKINKPNHIKPELFFLFSEYIYGVYLANKICHQLIIAVLLNCNFKRFLNIFIAPKVCTRNYIKKKNKDLFSCNTTVWRNGYSCAVSSFYLKAFFFVIFDPNLLQLCILNKIGIFPTKLIIFLFKCFILASQTTLFLNQALKDFHHSKIKIKKRNFSHTGKLRIFRRKPHTFSTSHSENHPHKLFEFSCRIVQKHKALYNSL